MYNKYIQNSYTMSCTKPLRGGINIIHFNIYLSLIFISIFLRLIKHRTFFNRRKEMGKFKDLMKQTLSIRGSSERTIDIYLRSMENFVRFFNKPPDKISIDEINQYQYHLKMKNVSYSVFNQFVSAVKFFHKNVLRSNLSINRITYTKTPKKLPVVLSKEEINNLYQSIANIKHKTIFMTIYACGLRVSEASQLKVEDIDSKRMMLRIRCAKGKKDRYVPLSKKLLQMLRSYWKTIKIKPKVWLFPSNFYSNGEKSISKRTIQKIIENAVTKVGIKKGVSVHTLRHSFATHIMEAGVDLRRIQMILGHSSISTTTKYIHLANSFLHSFKSPIETLNI
jgi:integrase/recombinase XerD